MLNSKKLHDTVTVQVSAFRILMGDYKAVRGVSLSECNFAFPAYFSALNTETCPLRLNLSPCTSPGYEIRQSNTALQTTR